MVKAYILMNIKQDVAAEVIEEMRKLDGVEAIDAIFGEYDLIAVVNVPDINKISRLITELRSKTEGIERTSTIIVRGDYTEAMSW